jgi:hypothetical protein
LSLRFPPPETAAAISATPARDADRHILNGFPNVPGQTIEKRDPHAVARRRIDMSDTI